ncbi:5'-deoxyadenosine deaminase-like protein [Drosera capensis]
MAAAAATGDSIPSTTVLYKAVIVTMDSHTRVYRNGGIVIEDDRIKAIGQSKEIVDRFGAVADKCVDLKGQFVLPGMVNTHVHTSQQIGRGIADDVDLMTWLHHRIWPYESHMTPEDSYISTLLCGKELIHSGVANYLSSAQEKMRISVTCFAEAGGQYVSEMARAVELLGLRACLVESTMDAGDGLPAAWSGKTANQCNESQKELYKKHHNTTNGRIRVWFGVQQIMNTTDQLLMETSKVSKELNTGLHMHHRLSLVVDTKKVDHGTATYLEKIGFLQDNLLSAHTVWVSDNENTPRSEAHLRSSALYHLLRASSDIFAVDDMYLASPINKVSEVVTRGATDPTTLPAEVVLKWATINGAKTVLWDNEIGSLEVGKKADMVIVDSSSWTMAPVHDRISNLVYCMCTENIISVMCNGKWIMKDEKILTVDEGEIIAKAKHTSIQLLQRAGINLPKRMQYL